MKPLLLSLALCLPTFAMAEGWTVTELSTLPDRAVCMERATSTFKLFIQTYGGGNIVAGKGTDDWTVAGYDLQGTEIDALIICPYEGGVVEPFLTVFNSEANDNGRQLVAKRLKALWDQRG